VTERPLFFDFDLPSLEAFFIGIGEKKFRAGQAMVRVYRKGARDFEGITEFSAALKKRLEERLSMALPRVVERQESRDGTVKLLLELADGERVETVLIPDEDRLTQCISTQAGCAMGCRFCRTASLGLSRSLSAGEIVSQVLVGETGGGFNRLPSNVVFMGMGEPLHNFDNTVRAFSILNSDYGPNIGKRRLTVSTCGLVDAMRRLPAEMIGCLAISLNATTDELRDRIMPVNKRYPLAELIAALRELPLPPHGRFTIEYVLLGGVNDTPEDARRLVKLLSGVKCMINLIPYHPHEESDFAAPTPEAVWRFQSYLLEKDFTAVLRKSRGEDIYAACGQLRAQAEKS
jgi:23S rRNA (adenine2503-C2)-methyltransferase